MLRSDVWHPPAGVAASGVGIVYLHGSAWYLLDKDVGTEALFRQLTAHGHVVMDLAYRLFPETDIPGMVDDAGRAVAWVAAHADELGIDPARIVLAGGSAGGHLALLAAYGMGAQDEGPEAARVCAVASLYGQADLAAVYEHTDQASVCHPDDPRPDWDAPPPAWMERVFGPDAGRLRLQLMSVAGRLDWLVGGTPEEVPERYQQLSPIAHVHAGCPPTLLVHGEHDEMAPVSAVRDLQRRLEAADVPVTAVYLPHTDHAFDLVGTRWSPAAQVGLDALERFLASVQA